MKESNVTPEAAEPKSESKARSRRGFAALDAERVRSLASLGGKAAHAKGTAHQFTADEAREAGRKGGLASRKKRAEP